MTTIAWDGETLAADSMANINGMVFDEDMVKIIKLKGELFGEKLKAMAMAGHGSCINYVKDWVCSGDLGASKIEGINFCVIVITDISSYYADDETPFLSEFKGARSVGSGYPFAYSAMKLGLNAVDAVKHAISLDVYSGGKVRKLKLR